LKAAHAAKDLLAIKSGIEQLNTVFQAASAEMYANAGNASQPTGEAQSSNGASEPTDVEYEEVK